MATIATYDAIDIGPTYATLIGGIGDCEESYLCQFVLNGAVIIVGYRYDEVFSTNVGGLTPGASYSYYARFFNGIDWQTGGTVSFSTEYEPPPPPDEYNKNLYGGLSFVGTLNKTHYHPAASTSKSISGGLAFSGSMDTNVMRAKALTGGLGFDGALATNIGIAKALDGGLAFDGALTMLAPSTITNKSLAGGLSFAGGLTTNTKNAKNLTGGLALTGSLRKYRPGIATFKNISGGLAFKGVLRMARVIQTDSIMLLSDLLDELGIILNELNQADTQPHEYNPLQLVNFLNRAQDQIMTLMPFDYFTCLYEVDEDVALTATGTFNRSALTSDIYMTPKAVRGIKVNGEYWANLLTFNERLVQEKAERDPDTEHPVYYIRGNDFYVDPGDASDTVDVHYIRKPAKMVLNTTGDTDDDTNCELPIELHEVLLNLAASIGYEIGKDPVRAKNCTATALALLEELKKQMHTTDSTVQGLGYPTGASPFAGSGGTSYTSFLKGNY